MVSAKVKHYLRFVNTDKVVSMIIDYAHGLFEKGGLDGLTSIEQSFKNHSREEANEELSPRIVRIIEKPFYLTIPFEIGCQLQIGDIVNSYLVERNVHQDEDNDIIQMILWAFDNDSISYLGIKKKYFSRVDEIRYVVECLESWEEAADYNPYKAPHLITE